MSDARLNDFSFKIATVNGTGSASANSLLMQAIFRMGIPVTGKNIFPSNIQGFPTWYEIRVSKDGYTARPPDIDLVVAINPSTYDKDVATVKPGGFLLSNTNVATLPSIPMALIGYTDVGYTDRPEGDRVFWYQRQ